MEVSTLNEKNNSIDTMLFDSEFGLMTGKELKNILENTSKEANIFIKNSSILHCDKLRFLKKLERVQPSHSKWEEINEILKMIKDESKELIKYSDFLPIEKVKQIYRVIWKNYEIIVNDPELDFKLTRVKEVFKKIVSNNVKFKDQMEWLREENHIKDSRLKN